MVFLHVGNDNYVEIERIVSIASFNSRRIKGEVAELRKRELGEKTGAFLDATKNKKTASVIICDNGQYIASSIAPSTLCKRVKKLATENDD